jgi:hypothetical protein
MTFPTCVDADQKDSTQFRFILLQPARTLDAKSMGVRFCLFMWYVLQPLKVHSLSE